MKSKLWEASIKLKESSELFSFEKFLSKKINKRFFKNFNNIQKWSVNNSDDFWSIFWDFSQIKGIKSNKK